MKKIHGLSFHRLLIRDIYKDLKLGDSWDSIGGYLMNRERVGIPIRHALHGT